MKERPQQREERARAPHGRQTPLSSKLQIPGTEKSRRQLELQGTGPKAECLLYVLSGGVPRGALRPGSFLRVRSVRTDALLPEDSEQQTVTPFPAQEGDKVKIRAGARSCSDPPAQWFSSAFIL